TAAAIWRGPVSPEIASAADCISAARSETDVGGAGVAAPPDACDTASARARSFGPHVTSECSPARSRRAFATAPKRSGGQHLFGHAAPGLITMYPFEPPEAWIALTISGVASGCSRNSGPGGAICSADRIDRFFRMTWPLPSGTPLSE